METSKLLALKLSALNESDFNWVYEQLKPEVKDELAPIVKEIKEIGFKVNHTDIDALLKKNAVNQSLNDLDVDAQSISKACYEDIRKVFARESSVLLNTLSTIEAWGWIEDKAYISRSKSSGGVRINQIESKKLLKKSLISATAKQLRKNNLDESTVNTKPSKGFAKASQLFGKLIKRDK